MYVTYSVTESSSAYPLHTEVYCGKKRSRQASEFGHSHNVVKELLTHANLLNKGYHLYVDNSYTSPVLAEYLFAQNTLLTGTLRSNRKGVPMMLETAKPKVGECFYAKKGPLLALSWKEKKMQKNPCLMLTTGIGAGMVNHTRRNGQARNFPRWFLHTTSIWEEWTYWIKWLTMWQGKGHSTNFGRNVFSPSLAGWSFVHTFCMSKIHQPSRSSHESNSSAP